MSVATLEPDAAACERAHGRARRWWSDRWGRSRTRGGPWSGGASARRSV